MRRRCRAPSGISSYSAPGISARDRHPGNGTRIGKEPSLAYRPLRFINTAGRGNHPVESIVRALSLLGTDEIRKWVSLVAAIGLAGPRSKELIRIALIRARFCEHVARHLKVPASNYYLTGLFSLLKTLLDRPLHQILEEVPIPSSCREALNGASNGPGNALRLAIASETGDWAEVEIYCDRLKCSETQAWDWQHDALAYVGKLQLWIDRGLRAGRVDFLRIAIQRCAAQQNGSLPNMCQRRQALIPRSSVRSPDRPVNFRQPTRHTWLARRFA